MRVEAWGAARPSAGSAFGVKLQAACSSHALCAVYQPNVKVCRSDARRVLRVQGLGLRVQDLRLRKAQLLDCSLGWPHTGGVTSSLAAEQLQDYGQTKTTTPMIQKQSGLILGHLRSLRQTMLVRDGDSLTLRNGSLARKQALIAWSSASLSPALGFAQTP